MSKVFGIDLGTTYSCIYFIDEYGQPAVITNHDNKPVTPSVVYFESADNVVVGDNAKAKLETDPDFVCRAVKRKIGNRDWYFEAYGIQYDAETISSLILKKLTQDASVKLGEEVKDVVITCPAYFDMAKRKATENAGIQAGLNVLSIVNEPTAAAISYGLDLNKPETVLVYDLGGGTFDVTIIQVDPGKSIRVVASDGDHNLGGKNWDETIINYVVNEFAKRTGKNEDDLFEDHDAMGELELKVENAKKELSDSEKCTVKVTYGGVQEKIVIARDLFNSLTSGWLENTIALTKSMLEVANRKNVTSYDKILLVGGSTKMPQVIERLQVEFPNTEIIHFDQDEAVAKGAAKYAQRIQDYNIIEDPVEEDSTITADPGVKPSRPKITGAKELEILTNVMSNSYGIVTTVEENGNEVEKISNILFRQDDIPANVTQTFGTYCDNQKSVHIQVYESKLTDKYIEIEKAIPIVEGVMEPLPPNLPEESDIIITMMFGEDGMLKIVGHEPISGLKKELDVKIADALTQEQIEENKKKIASIKIKKN